MTSTEAHFTGWRTSSRSTAGQSCVEVALAGWRTNSRSTAGQECVEVAVNERVVGLRDSKNPEGDPLVVSPRTWATFLTVITT